MAASAACACPYLARYRTKTASALVALTVASLATLAVPVAARRIIDFGFNADSTSMSHLRLMIVSPMIALAALSVLASASRVYLVITLGERIVATCVAARFRISLHHRRPFLNLPAAVRWCRD